MKEIDLNATLDDGPEETFEDATLELNGSSNKKNKALSPSHDLPNGKIPNESTGTFEKERQVAQIPWADVKAEDFFSFRDGLLENAVQQFKDQILIPEDGQFLGAWLLTEVSSWDNEMERLVILTDKQLITIKYDFIALKILDHRKVPLSIIDTLVVGDLEYPPVSLIPHIDGLTTGVTSLMKGCLVKVLEKQWPAMAQGSFQTEPSFIPRSRNVKGVRAMWNGGRPIPLLKKWNPFQKNIPFSTFTSHPLLWHIDTSSNNGWQSYSIDNFAEKLKKALDDKIQNNQCFIEHNPIILENYIGLGALIHNKNALGFFKVRGKFSF